MRKLFISLMVLLSFSTFASEHSRTSASFDYSCTATLTENSHTRELAISKITSPSGNPTFFAKASNAQVVAEMYELDGYVKITIDFEGKRLETISGFAGTPDSTTQGLIIGLAGNSNSIAGAKSGIGLECARGVK